MALIRLWAVCPRLTQRMDLGEAQSLADNALATLALVHSLWFGEWKGQKVHVTTSFDKVAEVYDDVTQESVDDFTASMQRAGSKGIAPWKAPAKEIVLTPISVTEDP